MNIVLESRLARGMELIPQLADLPASQVSGNMRGLYKDIESTLRVPFVNFIFRTLANFPAYFPPAWAALAPHLRTLEFEHAADSLRTAAATDAAVAPIEHTATEDGDRQAIAAFTDAIHYVLPKLLLIVTAFDLQLDGGFAVSTMPAGALQNRLPYGVAAGAGKLELVEPTHAEQRVQDLFHDIQRIHAHPGIASYYRGLAAWPAFLATVWNQVRGHVESESYQRRKQTVLTLAEETVTNRLLQKSPQSASPEQDPVGAILAVFRYRLIPDLLLDVALVKAMLDGPQAALRSGFSVS